MVVYGLLLPAIGWYLALLVWGYALAWFVVQDFLKVRFYGFLDSRGPRQAKLPEGLSDSTTV